VDKTIQKKLINLRSIIKNYEKVIIAFSGGVDSTFLLKIASDTIGNNCIAVTLHTPAHSLFEMDIVNQIAKSFHLTPHIIPLDITNFDEIIKNPPDRCYHCKKYMFLRIKEFAEKNNISSILEGSNLDDLNDYRPGLKALKELDIKSPLIQAAFTKQDIRKISKELDLPTWNKPANPCLATRIPYGTPITKEILSKIDKAEEFLYSLGLAQFRVRYHNTIARIEANKKDFDVIFQSSNQIIKRFKDLGFKYITVDIEGYRSGSLNEGA
jgi:pyridinium-3,5-biscarboxylic acid mononucleotide sulfurtransferase